MKVPGGVKVYTGRRVSLPGSEVNEKLDSVVKKSGDFHKTGKDAEKTAKDKVKTEAAAKIKSDKDKKIADIRKENEVKPEVGETKK